MKYRTPENKKILKSENLSIDEVAVWVRVLFSGWINDGSLDRDVLAWFLEVVSENYIKAETAKKRQLILRKALHTKEVVEVGVEIAKKEGLYGKHPWFVLVCFLHDVGRFSQALMGNNSDDLTGIDHGDLGASLILKRFEGEWEETKLKTVAQAVKWHNKKEYLGGDVYVKLVRDADKMANVLHIEELLEDYKYLDGPVTSEAWKSFVAGEIILHKDMNTELDFYLTCLAWESDLNFEVTKKMFAADDVKGSMLEKVRERGLAV